jgi:sporulation integral membrane protein YtvI
MKEKIYNLMIYSLGLLSLGAVIYVVFKYLLPLLIPFIIAWMLVALTKSGAESLADKMHIPRRIVRLVSALTSVLVLSMGLGLILWRSSVSLFRFLSDVAESRGVLGIIEELLSSERPILGNIIPKELATVFGRTLDGLISSAMSKVGELATELVGALPTAFLFLLVTIISIVYFALDYESIQSFVIRLLPKSISDRLSDLRRGTLRVMGKYLRSYAIIMLITYITIFLGLLLLRVEHSPIIALLIAFLDVLPVIGVGTVLLPWSLISFALGDKFLGVGLILLFVVNAVLRQLIEPKIVGKSLNLHPLVSLGAIYLGYALFGFAGLFILPLTAILLSAFLSDSRRGAQVKE